MAKHKHAAGDDDKKAPPSIPRLDHAEYHATLHALQIELVKLQRDIISGGAKILVILEGRDSGGKDGAIKRITEHLSPRETRIIALSKPSDRETGQWYFQRYATHLPSPAEIVLFNRSWYNRAGVERVMGFCTDAQYEEFMATVLTFEAMLIGSGIQIVKYYLDITKDEQKKRLKSRKTSPLKQWKSSPIDAQATKNWEAYSEARNAMFARTHNLMSPWIIVRADDKRQARINLIRDLLARIHYKDADKALLTPNPNIVFAYDEAYLRNGMIAP